jgi:ADP-heptose:LPS heptosyltransferase
MACILVIQLGRLGDVIQTTPLLNELLECNRTGTVDVLVFDSLREIVEDMGLRKVHGLSERSLPISIREMDKSIEQSRKQLGPVSHEAQDALRDLALPGYDRIVNCSYSPIGAFVAQNTKSKSVTGPVIAPTGEILFHHPAQIYLCARANFRDQNWFNLVDLWRASGHPYHDHAPTFVGRSHVPIASELPFEIPPGRIVALNPGSSDAIRRWPPANFAFLAEGLVSHGLVPALIGAPSDRETCAEVQARSAVKIENFCGKTSVPELALFLTRADLLVSNDTGAIHIAAAVGCRTLSLFGSTAYFAETAPWAEGHVILQGPLGSGLILLHPQLVLAAAFYCLGRMDESELQREIARQNASAWETFYLEPQADPLGGISYRPLHQNNFSPEQAFTRELRHLFARVFCESEEVTSMASSFPRIAQPPSRSTIRRSRERDVEGARFIALLESMAEAAARCRILCARQTRESAAEIASLSASLIDAMEQLKTHSESHSRTKPAIHFLDWTCRMMDPIDPDPTFHAHEQAYQLAARILREAELCAESKLDNLSILTPC